MPCPYAGGPTTVSWCRISFQNRFDRKKRDRFFVRCGRTRRRGQKRKSREAETRRRNKRLGASARANRHTRKTGIRLRRRRTERADRVRLSSGKGVSTTRKKDWSSLFDT